ncbi:MAG: IMS domain-containing protein [Cyanobacteria bacterium P01_C01_bin.72]
MRIPLDYYRILSVPVKATSAQLEQAYQDRLVQQPRREFSEQAVEARQQLIEYSFQVLSDPEQRASYDAQFLLNMEPVVTLDDLENSVTSDEGEDRELSPDGVGAETEIELPPVTEQIPSANPTIEIADSQIVGALIVLHELGEYETALCIGIEDFNRREVAESEEDLAEVFLDTTQEDLILVLTLAYMELGREQWHRREYESAAVSSRLGIDLLQQKNLFPHLQEELEQDLAKLRPYRVLELISQNPEPSAARKKGFNLLQSMLNQRQGIEGKGEDRSGLNFDQFLCFVQQLRTYLTSGEQQQLFDNESQAKSAIANYLAVYALLGRGFSCKQPELILRAQRKLDYLAEKQDVSWEQAIAALLLGHTQKAIRKLKSSADPAQLHQVQQHSIGSSDLLPGLCFYGEQWLHQDVLAQFEDLSSTQLTLKEYFADPQVQAYLEELTPPVVTKTVAHHKSAAQNVQTGPASSGIMSLWRNINLFAREKQTSVSASRVVAAEQEIDGNSSLNQYQGAATATIERHSVPTAAVTHTSGKPPSHHRRLNSRKPLSLPLQPQKTRAVPPSVIRKAESKAHRRQPGRHKKRSPNTLWKGWLFIVSLILGVGTVGYLGTKLLLSPANKTASKTQLAIALNRPSVEMPVQKAKAAAVKSKLTLTEQSQQVVQKWLDSKSAAFGSEHQIDRLNSILAEPLLTTWRERAIAYQQGNTYRQYEHAINIRSAVIDPNNQDKATVNAEVKEVAQHYQSGQLDPNQSYDDNLLVRYQLVRQGEQWVIQQTEVLETL